MSIITILHQFWQRISIISSLIFFVGCGPTQCGKRVDVSPEEQLRSYIDLAVNITRMDQREELENFTTGEFKDQITSASAEVFKRSYLDRRYEFDEFEVTNKTEVNPKKEVHLEYRVKFRSWLTGEDKTRVPAQDIKSLAVLKYTNGQWAIASIRPLDTTFNWDFGLPLDNVSTKGVTVDSPVVDPYAETPPQDAQGAAPASSSESPASVPSAPMPASESVPGK